MVVPDGGLSADQPIGWFFAGFSPLSYAAGNVFTAKFRPADIDDLASANGMLFASALILDCDRDVAGAALCYLGRGPLVNALILMHGIIAAVAFTLFFVLVRIAGPCVLQSGGLSRNVFGIRDSHGGLTSVTACQALGGFCADCGDWRCSC